MGEQMKKIPLGHPWSNQSLSCSHRNVTRKKLKEESRKELMESHLDLGQFDSSRIKSMTCKSMNLGNLQVDLEIKTSQNV